MFNEVLQNVPFYGKAVRYMGGRNGSELSKTTNLQKIRVKLLHVKPRTSQRKLCYTALARSVLITTTDLVSYDQKRNHFKNTKQGTKHDRNKQIK